MGLIEGCAEFFGMMLDVYGTLPAPVQMVLGLGFMSVSLFGILAMFS